MSKINYWKIALIIVGIWFAGSVLYSFALNDGVPNPGGAHRLVWLMALITVFLVSYKKQVGGSGKKWLIFIGGMVILFFLPSLILSIICGAVMVFFYLKAA